MADSNPNGRLASIRVPSVDAVRLDADQDEWAIPGELRLKRKLGRGILVGLPGNGPEEFVGIPQEQDGNLIVFGGNGSGKSTGIAMPTLETWDGPLFATDLKGELSARYEKLYHLGHVSRPYLRIDPMDPAGPSFDPFWWIEQDGAENHVENAFELATILFPDSPGDTEKFWCQSERAFFAAMVVFAIRNGLGFSEMTAYLLGHSLGDLVRELWTGGDRTVGAILGKMDSMKAETLACIERGIRNKLMGSAADPRISHFLRGRRETGNWFSWEDLDARNLFLCIPPDKLGSWGWVVNMMCAQLIRHLERKPEQRSLQGAQLPQTLVLLDEFPRFGKLEPLADGLATLRSKGVHFCLLVQSLAQLDLIYGRALRAVILDNCPYALLLQAGDAETQTYFSRLIGTGLQLHNSLTVRMDDRGRRVEGLSVGASETRDYRIHPHALAALEDVVFRTPLGTCRVEKFPPGQTVRNPDRAIADNRRTLDQSEQKEVYRMSMEQRAESAQRKLTAAQQKQRQVQRAETTRQRRMNHLRTQAVGTMVVDRFPELRGVDPGNTMEQAQARLQLVNVFLELLFQPEYAFVLRQIRQKADEIMQMPPADGPSGTEDDRSGITDGPVGSSERR